MIEIKEKAFCCGCNACVQRCPKQCISMYEDEEGFLYPQVDKLTCVECGLCEKVCPVINQSKPRKPLKVYAAYNKDEIIRKESSSAGVFTAIAEQIIDKGGVVFGARFDENWEVKHDFTETIEGLKVFRGSKYVQSRIEDSYQKAEAFLKEGRKVLFSGTPCQIAGLKKYLRKEYENLFTVDFICHGVPSPKVWRMYLDEIIARKCGKNINSFYLKAPFTRGKVHIKDISFRNKCLGWKKYSFVLTLSTTNEHGKEHTVSYSEIFTKNVFMRGFISDLYLRPSCYHCSSKNFKSGSDIMLGDYWGIDRIKDKYIDDDKGTCVLMVQTDKAVSLCNMQCIEVSYDEAQQNVMEQSVHIPAKRPLFWSKLKEGLMIKQTLNYACFPFPNSFKGTLIAVLSYIGLLNFILKIKKK